MKKLAVHLLQFLIVIFVFGLASCDDDGDGDNESGTADLLVGTWNTSDVDIDATVDNQSFIDYLVDEFDFTQEQAEFYYDLFISELESEITGTLKFNSDNTYESNFDDEIDNGTWSLSSDEKTLTLNDGSENIVLTINSISSNTLNVTITDDFTEDLDDDPGTPDEIIEIEADITLTK